MVKMDVELSVADRGLTTERFGYLRDSQMELEDLLAWTKNQLIVISDLVLREEQEKGFDKEPVMLVDGRKNKRIEDVKPLGQVEFIARQDLTDVLLEAYNTLLELSKVRTGTYKSSHFVFYNGRRVATDLPSLESWLQTATFSDKDVVRIINVQPYARRLELLGVTSTRQQNRRESATRAAKRKSGTQVRLPNGTYHLASRRLKSKYKNNVQINFTFLPGTTLGLSGSFKSGNSKSSVGRAYLYPTLVFRVQARGITNV